MCEEHPRTRCLYCCRRQGLINGVCTVCRSEDELPLSDCCGTPMPDWPDHDLCSSCLEHSSPHEEDECD